ncbi:MAG: FG-GAP-like repeat-containing protein, partial [Verrucomicrobiota bacterium]
MKRFVATIITTMIAIGVLQADGFRAISTVQPKNLLGVGSDYFDFGDFNGDGLPDLVTVNDGNLQVYRNRNTLLGGPMNFAAPRTIPVGFEDEWQRRPWPFPVAWVDANNDGALDIGYVTEKPNLLIGDGTGNFSSVAMNLPPLTAAKVSWIDFNGDGKMDLVLQTDGQASRIRVFVQRSFTDSGFEFVEAAYRFPDFSTYFATAQNPWQWCDLDGDGDLDALSTAGQRLGFPDLLWQTSPGVFELDSIEIDGASLLENEIQLLQADQGIELSLQDYDHDGDLDALGRSGTAALVLRNEGNGQFAVDELASQVSIEDYGTYASWVDGNSDGTYEVLITASNVGPAVPDGHSGFGMEFLHQETRGGPWLHKEILTPLKQEVSGVAFVDGDNDGDLDAFVFSPERDPFGRNIEKNLLSVRITETDPSPNPLAPRNLRSEVDGHQVSLSWEAPANLPGPVSYAVRIGTDGSPSSVLEPGSRDDGSRLIPRPGNAGRTTSLRFELPPEVGTQFLWSVQTIDSRHQGSPFAPDERFERPLPAPPSIQTSTSAPTLLTAHIHGNGLPTRYFFEWGPTETLDRTTPEISLTSTNDWHLIQQELESLEPDTLYYYRTVAVNDQGTSVSAVLSFRSPAFIQRETLEDLTLSAAASGDFDNDGDIDVVYAGLDPANDTRIIRLLRNDGTGRFSELPNPFTPVSNGSLDWGDYDNDGDLDLL